MQRLYRRLYRRVSTGVLRGATQRCSIEMQSLPPPGSGIMRRTAETGRDAAHALDDARPAPKSIEIRNPCYDGATLEGAIRALFRPVMHSAKESRPKS